MVRRSCEAWHVELSKLYAGRRWRQFAYEFKCWYVNSNDERQLKLLRSLQCEFMDSHVIKAVAKVGGVFEVN